MKDYREFVECSDEVWEACQEKIDAYNNKSEESATRIYNIGVTGKKHSYFTLWVNNTLAKYNPISFIQNLSTDFETAVEKTLARVKTQTNAIIVIDQTDNFKYNIDENTITFGKYEGKTIQEVFESDPQYVIWFANHYFAKTERMKKMQEHATELARLYFDNIRKENQANIVSEYITDAKIENVEIEITKSKIMLGRGYGDYVSYSAVDDNNHYYQFCGKLDTNYQIGERRIIKSAKVKGNFEKLGIKYNTLNYIKWEE